MSLRGSSSIEYLFVTGIAISALAIILIISMNTGSDSIRLVQAKDSVEKLANSADYVYSLGPHSQETVKIYLPHGINFINVSGNKIHMSVELSSGNSDVYATTKGTLAGSVSIIAGAQRVVIQSTGNKITLENA